MASVDGSRLPGSMANDNSELVCDPCKHMGSVTHASAFCGQCEEYMCPSCVAVHRGLKLTRGHDVQSIAGSESVSCGISGASKLSLVFCDEHTAEAIYWFCENHDAMFCETCKLIKHRKCKVTPISEIDMSARGHRLLDVAGSLVELKTRIGNLKAAREKSIEDLETLRKSLEDEIHSFKTELIDFVKWMEGEMIAELNKAVGVERDVIMDHMSTIERLNPHVDTCVRTADEAKTVADHVTSVIAEHKLSATLKTVEPTVSDLEHAMYDVNVSFQPSRRLTDVISGSNALGKLDITRAKTTREVPSMSVPCPVCPMANRKSWLDMEVESSAEINVSFNCITGSAVLSDGQAILVNRSNQVILLDKMLSLKSTLSLPNQPWDVAADGTDDVIVAMPRSKKLQWIGVGSTLRAGRIIKTHLKCYGVAVHAGDIYTSVCRYGGGGGHVLVLDRRGAVIRRVGLDAGGEGMFSWPCHITVNPRGSVYVSVYGQNRITCFTATGDVMYDVRHNEIRHPRGMSLDENDNLLVCCVHTNNIHVIKKDGSYHRVFASSTDGLVKPYSVSYRRCDQKLIVTMSNTPGCVAYTLK